jgi:hypothetical protein
MPSGLGWHLLCSPERPGSLVFYQLKEHRRCQLVVCGVFEFTVYAYDLANGNTGLHELTLYWEVIPELLSMEFSRRLSGWPKSQRKSELRRQKTEVKVKQIRRLPYHSDKMI